MSKSKGNTVDPADLITEYGADTVRLFSMFAAPPEQSLDWTDSGVDGSARFLKKLWRAVMAHMEAGEPDAVIQHESLDDKQKDLRRKTHETIKKVTDDYGRRQTFNTAIAAVMELLNEVSKLADKSNAQGLAVEREALLAAIQLLSPIVPHITHELWSELKQETDIVDAPWPLVDDSALARSSITIVAQVNGKVRAKMEVPADADKETLEHLALGHDNVQKFIDGKMIRKVIVVPGKLVNIVAN
jgi:leucyl-tRNA synthetase